MCKLRIFHDGLMHYPDESTDPKFAVDLNGEVWELRHKTDNPNYRLLSGSAFACKTAGAEVMFCCGLLDINLIDIYEGDVIRDRYEDGNYIGVVGVVRFDRSSYEKGSASMFFVTFPKGKYTEALKDIADTCEVIGNIHENPDWENWKED